MRVAKLSTPSSLSGSLSRKRAGSSRHGNQAAGHASSSSPDDPDVFPYAEGAQDRESRTTKARTLDGGFNERNNRGPRHLNGSVSSGAARLAAWHFLARCADRDNFLDPRAHNSLAFCLRTNGLTTRIRRATGSRKSSMACAPAGTASGCLHGRGALGIRLFGSGSAYLRGCIWMASFG